MKFILLKEIHPGIECDFSQTNIIDMLESLNVSFKTGDIKKYSLSLKAYGVIEITIETKNKILSEDLYQSVIVRIERAAYEPVRLPMVVKDAGSVYTSDNTLLLCVIGGSMYTCNWRSCC